VHFEYLIINAFQDSSGKCITTKNAVPRKQLNIDEISVII